MRLHTVIKPEVLIKCFEIIDKWLPKDYVSLVQAKIPAPSGTIRNIKSTRKGNFKIINAMVEVALENKACYEKLESIIK